jgi:aromatic ring-opening dioxygenase LigB subunit
LERANLVGAIVPHAPLLLEEVAEHPDVGRLTKVREAIRSLEVDADVVVIASPHGKATGVYARNAGDLSSFGVEFETSWERDGDVSRSLVEEWGKPMLRHVPDHGIVVPLATIERHGLPVVAASFEEDSDPRHDAHTLGAAVAMLALERRVLFIASANGSSGLTPRAPATEIPGAREVEETVVAELERDAGTLLRGAERLTEVGSCGLGPLITFAMLFEGRPAQIVAHEWPFGVGYLVATIG